MKEGKYWFYLMNSFWKYAPSQVRQIFKILKEFGIKNGRVLEIACGNGRICTNLAKRGFDVCGIDINPDYIKDAKDKAMKHKVKVDYRCGDIRFLKKCIKGKFDVVLSIATSIGYYDKITDQKIFKDVAKLLKKKGLFLILNTRSREWLLSHFCARLWDDTEEYVILHQPEYDRFHSVISDNWQFYRKKGKDLKFEIELPMKLKVYSQNELVEMVEKTGLKFIKAYDSLMTLQPVRSDSQINLVFQKL